MNDPSTYAPACENLRASGVNVIVAAVWGADLPELARLCKSHGVWGRGYAWILTEPDSPVQLLQYGATSGQTTQETAELLSGMLSFFASPMGTVGFSRFGDHWKARNASDCPNPFFNASEHPEIFVSEPWTIAAFAYDCVVAMASALSQVADMEDGDALAARFREARFDGASGAVAFDARADREGGNYVLYNLVANGSALVSNLAATMSLDMPVVSVP
eukprot:7381097-Prymnesium_polylepis.2